MTSDQQKRGARLHPAAVHRSRNYAVQSSGYGWIWIATHALVALLSLLILFLGPHRGVILGAFLLSLLVSLFYISRRAGVLSLTTWFLVIYGSLFFVAPLYFSVVGEAMSDDYGVFESETVATYSVLAIAGLHLFFIGRELTHRYSTTQNRSTVFLRADRVQLVLVVLTMVQYAALGAIVLDQGGLSPLLRATRVELQLERSFLSQLASLALYAAVPFYVLLPAYIRHRRRSILVWLLLALVVDVTVFFAFRIRSLVVAHIIALAAGTLWRGQIQVADSDAAARLSSVRVRLWKLVLVLLFTASLAIASRFLRGYVGTDAEATIDLREYARLSVTRGDMGHSWLVMRIIELVPTKHDYLHGQSYWRLILVPIPRSMYPEKPQNTERIVGQLLYPDVVGLTLPPGIVGDLYLNFGIVGIFGMLLVGAGIGRLDSIQGLPGMLLAGASFTPLFHFVRGGFTNSVLIFVVLACSCVLAARWSRPRTLATAT